MIVLLFLLARVEVGLILYFPFCRRYLSLVEHQNFVREQFRPVGYGGLGQKFLSAVIDDALDLIIMRCSAPLERREGGRFHIIAALLASSDARGLVLLFDPTAPNIRAGDDSQTVLRLCRPFVCVAGILAEHLALKISQK